MSKIKTPEEWLDTNGAKGHENIYGRHIVLVHMKAYSDYVLNEYKKELIEELESLSNTTPDPDTPESYFKQGFKHAIEIINK